MMTVKSFDLGGERVSVYEPEGERIVGLAHGEGPYLVARLAGGSVARVLPLAVVERPSLPEAPRERPEVLIDGTAWLQTCTARAEAIEAGMREINARERDERDRERSR